jgi:two-component system sensor histidine kinase QseC
MALLQDCLAERADWAEGLGVELSLDGPDTLDLPLDRQLLWSALGNVLDNALKHGCGPGAGRGCSCGCGRRAATWWSGLPMTARA